MMILYYVYYLLIFANMYIIYLVSYVCILRNRDRFTKANPWLGVSLGVNRLPIEVFVQPNISEFSYLIS